MVTRDVLREEMKRIGTIAVTAWGIALVAILVHAMWAHHSVAASAAHNPTPSPRIHMLMLISEGRDALLVLAALVSSVFMMRSSRRGPAVVMAVVAAVALLIWTTSFLSALRHTDRTFFALRPWRSTHFILFWHAFLDPAVQCLLAGIGLVCGIIGITRNGKTRDAEQNAAHVFQKPRAVSENGER